MKSLAIYQPDSEVLYSLDGTAALAGVPRRHIAFYVRHGLIQPAFDPRLEGWYFTAEAIQTLRRIEQLRAIHRLDVPGLKLVLELLREVEALRAEVRFFRGC